MYARRLLLVPFSMLIVAMPAKAGGPSESGLQACDADIHRLCQNVFPDEKKVATCLVQRRSELSRVCAELLANPPNTPDDDD